MPYASAVVVNPVDVVPGGIDITTLPTTPDGTNGNKVINDGRTYVEINNGSASPITVTINTNATVDGLVLPNRQVTIPNAKRYAIGPFKSIHNQADGYVWITFSAVTTVTMGAFRMP